MLHTRSAFSFLRGASQPEALVARAAELGHPAIAIADHDGFFGSPRAHRAAKAHGIRAIVATSVTLPDGTHLPLIARTRTGYQSLCQFLSRHHLSDPLDRPHHDLATLTPEGITCLSGDADGPIQRALAANNKERALQLATQLRDHFGREHFFIELVRHHIRGEDRTIRLLTDLADHLGVRTVACNAPLFASPAERLLGDAFTCLRHHTTLDQAGRLLAANSQRHIKSPQQMAALFADHPHAIDNQRRIIDSVEFGFESLGYRFPSLPDARGNPLSPNEEATELRRRVYAHLRSRFQPLTRRVKSQIEHELKLIRQLGFSGYFLIVHEIVQFARGEGILCQGRGSAANSAVCYALGITSVDPVNNGLLFERFLSENRQSWPDIDIDFPSGARRESVIQHVFNRFAPRGAAMTANVITYRARSAFREMSKVLGFPESIANRFAEMASSPRAEDLGPGNVPPTAEDLAAARHEHLVATIATAGIPPEHPRHPALLRLLDQIHGLPRHLGQHSGGMIICDQGLDSIVPLQPATMPGRTVVQWDKDDCEDLGIVKVDLLGLGMLAAMQDTLTLCQQRGRPVNLATIPKDDPKTYQLLCAADTVGTFQVESRAQMATLPVLRPACFYDLAIQIAIIRPGPIVGDLVHPYLNRRNGYEPVSVVHPEFEPILRRTLGVPLFQEQVLKMAMIVAGFDGSEADHLRRAMGFKHSDDRMIAITQKLRDRMTERGIDEPTQKQVIDSIGSFAHYGFPESHAISFALIAYASCWLKAHRTAEFYTGIINNQPMGFYNVNTLIQDAKHHGLRVLPPSVVDSEALTTVIDHQSIRLGLNRIRSLGRDAIERILHCRAAAPFTSVQDFANRTGLHKNDRRQLAKAGALNPLPNAGHRRAAQWQVELPLAQGMLAFAEPTPSPPPLPAMDASDRLNADLETQGHSVGPHPMAIWRRNTSQPPVATSATLQHMPHGQPVTTAGMVICRQRPGTANGHCFVSMEDEFGIINLFIPAKTFQQLRLTITGERFLLARGLVQISEGNVRTILTKQLHPLDAPTTTAPRSHDFH
ncbi:DNA polymerase III subunit alpha [Sulfuriroseicoccus oceanibius]|uniref:DNA-directed DNA polymerase n=1 Tax=Sulfuriroseicoccus oceanibius TaxID=2707525 RepID=A0A6B3L799_9BACT|nr:error-prone DNA polymerase [Sulfuriroseicoccus oceanibius]QQL43982.1 error-prone DNA polymerase [Sulfuriroseicoccus oceanibius]